MRAQAGDELTVKGEGDVITRAEVEKLGAIHAVAPTILSVYLTVPLEPGELSDLAARAGGLIAGAESAGQPDESGATWAAVLLVRVPQLPG